MPLGFGLEAKVIVMVALKFGFRLKFEYSLEFVLE